MAGTSASGFPGKFAATRIFFLKNLVNSKNGCTFASQKRKTPAHHYAKIAQLVEHDLAKVGV
ncbi:MAG: hypothetical protein K2F72_02545, partial [Muribaculaceae bacterium]|nr:hypothetical protein [Muribaculaceae bacterium]